MRLHIWGDRGSIPTPLSNQQLQAKLRLLLAEATPEDLATPEAREALVRRSPHGYTFGGNTSCIELSFDDSIFILDSGSGIRGLGVELKQTGRAEGKKLHLFQTHFHWDHICGLPFFGPIYQPGREIDVWSGRKDAEDLLRNQMSSANFPARWDRDVKADIRFHVLPEDEPTTVDGAEIRILRLNHPDLSFGYRFEVKGRKICYLTDTEISKNPHEVAGIYQEFAGDADLVIVDAMYGFLDYHDYINFGHSTVFNWIDIFGPCQLGELVIFHHDPLADDVAVHKLLASAIKYSELVAHANEWPITAAHEGRTWEWDD